MVGADGANSRGQVPMALALFVLETTLQHGCFLLLIAQEADDKTNGRNDSVKFSICLSLCSVKASVSIAVAFAAATKTQFEKVIALACLLTRWLFIKIRKNASHFLSRINVRLCPFLNRCHHHCLHTPRDQDEDQHQRYFLFLFP